MRHLLPVLMLPVAMSGCAAGYATDWFRDGAGIINPQLIRYGYDVEQSRCIAQKLGESVARVELRRFQERAADVQATESVVFTPANLRIVAGDAVAPKLDAAVAACNATLGAARVADAAPAELPEPVAVPIPAEGTVTSGGVPVDTTPITTPSATGTAATTGRTTWLNLGAADSGQSIAIDAMSIEQAGAARTAWFRMTDPETNAATNNLYRLRIDCAARTVQPLALRQVDELGTQISLREYTPAEATPEAAEAGTVLEIAFLSMCT